MPTQAAVLDADVMIPAAPRDTLLRAAQRGLYRVHWSEEILEEVRRNLVGHGLTTEVGARRLIDRLHEAFPRSFIAEYEPLLGMLTNHPKDRHMLAVAIKARAEVIVTSNLRHFPADALEPFGVAAKTADMFLVELFTTQADEIARIVIEQASARRLRPVTLEEQLTDLHRHAPTFVQLVREHLQVP